MMLPSNGKPGARMRRFVIEVSQEAFDRLGELARVDRRSVQDQAAIVLEQRMGVLASHSDRRTTTLRSRTLQAVGAAG